MNTKTIFDEMSKEEAIDYCYKYEKRFKAEMYADGEDGDRQFSCLITCLEGGTITPSELPEYGMEDWGNKVKTREIKFRAWDGHTMYFFDLKGLFNEGLEFNLSELDPKHLAIYTQFPYDRMPIMQFSGILGKEGKEVYEGDIVRLPSGVSEVVFENGCFYTPIGKSRYRLGGWIPEIEVIGNIYQNPELTPNKQKAPNTGAKA